jgi:hypothetical protein
LRETRIIDPHLLHRGQHLDRRRLGDVLDDAAVGEEEDPIGHRGGARIVRHHHRRLAELVDRLPQEPQHLAAGRGIEIPRRLVREDHLRPRHEGSRERDPLLLTAGELRRPMRAPLGEPEAAEQFVEPPAVGLLAGDRERQDDVLLRRQHREEVEELEDEADLLAPEHGQLLVGEPPDLDAVEDDASAGRAIEPSHDVHQGRLTGARGPHDRGQTPVGDIERDAAQGIDRGIALAVAADEVRRGGDGAGGRVRRLDGRLCGDGDGRHRSSSCCVDW